MSSLRTAQERFGGGDDDDDDEEDKSVGTGGQRSLPHVASKDIGSLASSSSLHSGSNAYGSVGRGSGNSSNVSSSNSLGNSCSIRVLIPPSMHGGGEEEERRRGEGIACRSFPLKPTATAREVTRMVARYCILFVYGTCFDLTEIETLHFKFRFQNDRRMKVANAEDFALFLLDDGKGTYSPSCALFASFGKI